MNEKDKNGPEEIYTEVLSPDGNHMVRYIRSDIAKDREAKLTEEAYHMGLRHINGVDEAGLEELRYVHPDAGLEEL